ncbi:unnamed protein product [Arctia plantaginis]|uniref:Uncharacterized protein n=1 Tax=Arctia plantaginis TaxID=874455 RepID=A0A8S0ZHR8_ARCPL|nr:unnamed protein product [Arctia plantaginis]
MEGNIIKIFLFVVFVASVSSAPVSAPLAVSSLTGDAPDISLQPELTQHPAADGSDDEDLSERFYMKFLESDASRQTDINSDNSDNLVLEDRVFDGSKCPDGTHRYHGICCPVVDRRARCDLVEQGSNN